MAKSPGLAFTKEREMGVCDASCPPPAAPAPHPHPPPHIQQMLQFRKFTTAPQMSTVRSGKNLRMVRMWIVDMHPAPPVVWHLHIFRGYCVYTLLVSKLVFNFIESIAAFTQPCECHQVSEKRAGVAETSTIEAVAGRFSAPNPQRGRLWGRSVGKEGRGHLWEVEVLLAVGRCLHQLGAVFRWGRPKVEEVNIVTLVY